MLVVEDNAQTRQLIIKMLWKAIDADLEICECSHGGQSVVKHAEFCPDWTLMDINLPGISGLEATREILRCNPAARIAVITGLKDSQWREAAMEAGAMRFIEKDNLYEAIRHIQVADGG